MITQDHTEADALNAIIDELREELKRVNKQVTSQKSRFEDQLTLLASEGERQVSIRHDMERDYSRLERELDQQIELIQD